MYNEPQTERHGIAKQFAEELPSRLIPYLLSELGQLFHHFRAPFSRNARIEHYRANFMPVISLNIVPI